MLKLANPIYYPLAILTGGIILIVGVRFFKVPNLVIIPSAIAISTLGASFLKGQEPSELSLATKQLKQELQSIKLSAKNLAKFAEVLRQEAQTLLNKNTWSIDLLVAVQQACDRALEMPIKIDKLAENISLNQSLLSINELEQQLLEVNNKLINSSGVARDHLQQLATKLESNIKLAQSGQDNRQAQIINLQMLIQELAGFLQQLQNKLITSDLNNIEEIQEIRNLSSELNSLQDNLDILL